jgi:hypothetical protein
LLAGTVFGLILKSIANTEINGETPSIGSLFVMSPNFYNISYPDLFLQIWKGLFF